MKSMNNNNPSFNNNNNRSGSSSASASAGAVALFAALHARDPLLLERRFQYLTPPALQSLEDDMTTLSQQDRNIIIAQAVVRRMVHKCLDGKYSRLISSSSSSNVNNIMEDALKYHTLPETLQNELQQKYFSKNDDTTSSMTTTTIPPPPTTWYEALKQLKLLSNNDSAELWRLILDHPMTSYVPMQCQTCGYIVPDSIADGKNDAEIGLSELEPTGTELEIRGGWFRGRPRGAKLLVLDCPNCCHESSSPSTSTSESTLTSTSNTTTTTTATMKSSSSSNNRRSIWYRSGHPQIILTPHRWGRLCGEQEDLRMQLAEYLNIPLRLCIPLDWDHIWSEFYNEKDQYWEIPDDSARNFAVRLEEGIGSWTRVWVIHPKPELCQDVTNDYLNCRKQQQSKKKKVPTKEDSEEEDEQDETHNGEVEWIGRADEIFADRMEGYRRIVQEARLDETAQSTQAKTLNGYVLERADFDSERITKEMQKAAMEYGDIQWWQL